MQINHSKFAVLRLSTRWLMKATISAHSSQFILLKIYYWKHRMFSSCMLDGRDGPSANSLNFFFLFQCIKLKVHLSTAVKPLEIRPFCWVKLMWSANIWQFWIINFAFLFERWVMHFFLNDCCVLNCWELYLFKQHFVNRNNFIKVSTAQNLWRVIAKRHQRL